MGRGAMLSGWRPQGHLGISPSTGSEPGYIRGAARSGPEMRLNVPLITVSEKAPGETGTGSGEESFLQPGPLLSTTQRRGRLRQRE